jgi:hyaluronan synthase
MKNHINMKSKKLIGLQDLVANVGSNTFELPKTNKPSNWKHKIIIGFTLLLLISASIATYYLQPQIQELKNIILSSKIGVALVTLSATLLGFRLLFLFYLLTRYIKYRPISSVSDNLLPTITVIVPAYNEGKLVYDTLHSLAASDYPQEKIQILCIDDGSKDDTWQWMQKAYNEIGNCINLHQQPKNLGKRHALYHGFNIGSGDIFVTVDSDSIVLPDTLRNLVSPLVLNPSCGAVAGKVRVLNDNDAMIPKMLNVSFAYSFDFIRSAQSTLGTVLCTPGALSAYRKEAVYNCLEDWFNQHFMGKRTDIGEDRAMTNMILKQGFHVLYQQNALVYTNVPETFSGLHKMFTRWERSNVRENIMMTKFAFKRFRQGPLFGSRLLLIKQWIGIVTAYPALILMILFFATHPLIFLSSSLFGILIFSSIPVTFYAINYNISQALWAYCYSLFYTFSLFWITPYAIITASRRGWLTRELS